MDSSHRWSQKYLLSGVFPARNIAFTPAYSFLVSFYLQKQVQARAQAAVLSAWKSLARGVERGESNALKLFFELKNRHTDEKNAFDIHMDEESRKAAA